MDQQRIALVIDLENLVRDKWLTRDWEGAALIITGLVHSFIAQGTVIARVAACASESALNLGWAMHQAGIRFHVHDGSPDAAGRMLIDWLENDLPPLATTIVLASGNAIFVPVTLALRESGKRVEVVARPKMLSAELRQASDAYHPIRTLDESPP